MLEKELKGFQGLSHLNEQGRANMVDVSSKPPLLRCAKASGKIFLAPSTLKIIKDNAVAKGDVYAVAQVAAIQAAKKTSDLIPLCHSLPLSRVGVTFEMGENYIEATCESVCVGATGVEMEALMGVNVALLTIYDMCKAVDKNMTLSEIKLLSKTKTSLLV